MWIVFKLLYFMLPAYIGNMAPPLGKNFLKFLAVPVDFGKKWNGKPILGSHKTWRGVFLATAAGALVFLLQRWLYSFEAMKSISMIDYASSALWIGVLLGFGAITGDAVKSFFKRRAGIKSGSPWIPFDQIDFTIGALAFASFIYFPGWKNAVIIVVISAFGHILINHIGYYLGVRDVKW